MKKIIFLILTCIASNSLAFNIAKVDITENNQTKDIVAIQYKKDNIDNNYQCQDRIAGDLARYLSTQINNEKRMRNSVVLHPLNRDYLLYSNRHMNNFLKDFISHIKSAVTNNKEHLKKHLVGHGHLGYIPTLYAPIDVCFSPLKDNYRVYSSNKRSIFVYKNTNRAASLYDDKGLFKLINKLDMNNIIEYIADVNDLTVLGRLIKKEMEYQADQLIDKLLKSNLRLVAAEIGVGNNSKAISLLVDAGDIGFKYKFANDTQVYDSTQMCMYLRVETISSQPPKKDQKLNNNKSYKIEVASIFPVKDKYDLWKNEGIQYIEPESWN